MSVRFALFSLLFSVSILAPHAASEEKEAPASLETVRHEAEAMAESGDGLSAARHILGALRGLPRNQPLLAEEAIGPMQLLLFTNEYLLHPEERDELYATALDEEGDEMHRLAAVMMRFTEDGGLSQEEVNNSALKLYYLSVGEHGPARMAAGFIMSNPYYFYDTEVGHDARDRMAREFPGSYLAAEAERLPLYYAKRGRGAGIKEALSRKTAEGELREHTLRLREDAVGRSLHDTLSLAQDAHIDEAAVYALTAALDNAASWEDEYAALNILDGFRDTDLRAPVAAAANRAVARATDPRAVYRARVLRMTIDAKTGDCDPLARDAAALLDARPLPVVPERNNWEELKNAVRLAADALAKAERTEEARALLARLAARYPNSALAADCAQRIAALDAPAN